MAKQTLFDSNGNIADSWEGWDIPRWLFDQPNDPAFPYWLESGGGPRRIRLAATGESVGMILQRRAKGARP
jgi:hypothetical protein